MKNFSRIFYLLASFLVFFPRVFAISVDSPVATLPGSVNADTTEKLLPSIISSIIGLVAVLAIIAITWAGIQMFLSVGNEDKFKQARMILIYALIGVGLAGSAYLIVNVVANLSF